MSQAKYTIGLDYGTDSVRSLIVNVENGEEVASVVFEYPRWKKQMYCDAPNNRFRQHPKDYLEGMEYTIVEALKLAPAGVAENVGRDRTVQARPDIHLRAAPAHPGST